MLCCHVLRLLHVIRSQTIANGLAPIHSQKYQAAVVNGLEDSTRLVGHLTVGISPSQDADMLSVNKSAFYQLKAKFEGTVKRKKGSGRSSTTSQEQEKIVQAHEDDPFLIPAKTATSSNVKAQTVRRRLQEH